MSRKIFCFLGSLTILVSLTGCFATTEQRVNSLREDAASTFIDQDGLNTTGTRCRNLGKSVDNICLDGDGVN